MAENAHTHGWGKSGTCPAWTGVCHRIGIKSYASNISFEGRPNPAVFENGRVAKWAHDLRSSQIANMAATVCQAQEEFSAGFKISWAPKSVPPYHTWVMISIERNVEIHGRHLTS